MMANSTQESRGKASNKPKQSDRGSYIWDVFFEKYGPHAFGVASLLIIWFSIVNPAMERNRIDWETQKDVVNQMQVTSEQLRTTAQIIERTAIRLQEIE